MMRSLLAPCAIVMACLPAHALFAGTEVTFRTGQVLMAESVEMEGSLALIRLAGGGSIGVERTRIASMREMSPAVPPAAREDEAIPSPAASSNPEASPEPAAPAQPAKAEADPSVDQRALILGLIDRAAEAHGVDRDLLRSLIEVESSMQPASVSPKGAMGLAQLMPATAAELGVSDPFDPAQSVDAAARYLKVLLDQSGGEFVGALAAYNAGQGTVRRYGGLPPYRETIRYIEKVLEHYAQPE